MYSAARNLWGGRRYGGMIRAVTGDAYSIAPVIPFHRVYTNRGFDPTISEVREPMGRWKRKHLEIIGRIPRIAEAWVEKYGCPMNKADLNTMYEKLIAIQLQVLPGYSAPIPEEIDAFNWCRNEGIKTGLTTGFFRSALNVLITGLEDGGLKLDTYVAGDDPMLGDRDPDGRVLGKRPRPFMIFEAMRRLGVDHPASVLKIDDTVVGIEEGLNAGCWTLGVAGYSSDLGIESLEHRESMSRGEFKERLDYSTHRLRSASAHYVVETLADLPEVVEEINLRLAVGEQP